MFTIQKIYLRTWCKKNSACVKAANRNSKAVIRSLKKMARNADKCQCIRDIIIMRYNDENGLDKTKVSGIGGEVIYDGCATNNTLEKLLVKNGYQKITDTQFSL